MNTIIINLLKEHGWVESSPGIFTKNGFQLQLTDKKLIVQPQKTLATAGFKGTYHAGLKNDWITLKQVHIQDIIGLIQFLENNKTNRPIIECAKKRKLEKKIYCEGCVLTKSENKYCEHMDEDDYGAYCSLEEHWNTWYCLNARRKAFFPDKENYPHFGHFICSLTEGRCPYSVSYLAPSALFPPDRDTPKIALIYILKGHKVCKEYKKGRG